jgi:hypothetical protein
MHAGLSILDIPQLLVAILINWCSLWGLKFCMKSQIIRESLVFSSTAIFGPILLFGGIGYMVDKYAETGKIFLFVGLGLAFLTTQVLMLRKVKEFAQKSNTIITEASKKPEAEVSTQES